MGKILFVNLSTGEIKPEEPDEKLYRDFIGGYGLGARFLYSRQKARVDTLGPDNIFGMITGPLTGSPHPVGTRYVAVGKSPLTGGWGDANSGGDFGPYLKFAGYDAVFFVGIADKPVYLFIDNGRAEIKDASHLWGRSVYETEDTIKSETGTEVEVACIGPASEKLCLIAGIITGKGSAAARSGLGAVMGSKKLKAVAVRGSQKVPVADPEMAARLRAEFLMEFKQARPQLENHFLKYGTSEGGLRSIHSGDSPVKNWGGVGVVDIPDASGLAPDNFIANLDRRLACWHCPIACKGLLKEGKGEYRYPAGTHRIEYETQASFGAMCCITNPEALAMANHLCNYYGLDTISAGTSIAFAMECYDKGLITKKDTDGIELTWGNHKAMIAMIEKMAKREGFGDILADGVKVAAKRIGKGAEEYAVHIGGQEPGMHDPKFQGRDGKYSSAYYQMNATPGRHIPAFGPGGFGTLLNNAAGVCMLGGVAVGPSFGRYIEGFMIAVTGWQRSMDELLKAGERIGNIRHAFNLREGINELEWRVHPRIAGWPPQKEGPLAEVTVDIEAEAWWNLGALDWDRVTTRPSVKKLKELGLEDVAKDLWPPVTPADHGH